MNHWSCLSKKMESNLDKGFPEQLPYKPNDPLITKNKGSVAIKSGQGSSINVQGLLDLPIGPKVEQGLTEDGRNAITLKGEGSDSVYGSVDEEVSHAAASFPRFLQNEESENSLEVPPNPTTGLSINDPCNDICSGADPESQEPHLANIADLIDMPYCDSLMIVPPDSPNGGNSTTGM